MTGSQVGADPAAQPPFLSHFLGCIGSDLCLNTGFFPAHLTAVTGHRAWAVVLANET